MTQLLSSLGQTDMYSIVLWLSKVLILIGSIIIHEVSHGYSAYLLGDTTAKRMGRLSLNPIKHIDPMGTIAIPVIMLIISGGSFAFGYAKPVPINPANFPDERKGMLFTGAAGPVSNILLAIIGGVGFRVLNVLGAFSTNAGAFVGQLFIYLVIMNLVLAFFNLIPIPPLDGSRIVQRFLSSRTRYRYHQLEPYGFGIIILVSFLLPSVFQTYMSWTVSPIAGLLLGL